MKEDPKVAEVMARIHRYACLQRGLSPEGRGSLTAIGELLGMSRQGYANLRRGRTTMKRTQEIARTLGVDPDDPSPRWLELKQLLESMEADGLDVSAFLEALPDR